jgi:chorismate-pyruvate lyase
MSQKSPPLTVSPFLYPLDEFYAQAGRALPVIKPVDGTKVPEPYRSLLVHSGDMTSTLESFHGESIRLEVLSRQERGDFYFREVVLILVQSGRPVEFGAIKMNLALFPPTARRQILDEKLPLGRILEDYKIVYSNRPKGFFRIESDGFIQAALGLPGVVKVFGRRNALLDPRKQALAEVVEILPPIAKRRGELLAV